MSARVSAAYIYIKKVKIKLDVIPYDIDGYINLWRKETYVS